jgi:transposase
MNEEPQSKRRRRGRPTAQIILSDDERQTLQRWAQRPRSSQALALRCRIVLACADGLSNVAVGEQLGVHPVTVAKWRTRFAARRLQGLADEPRPGVPRSITDEQVEQVIVKTLEETPRDATHWSTRSMARATGMSQTAISRIWRAFGLKPHLVQTWKLSSDPQFIDKVRDICGLYLNPPEAAVVLCVDEKSQIQALDRTAPILPLRPGLAERRTHDYFRHGTTTLFAALEVATGKVTDRCFDRHRHIEFLAFCKQVAKAYPRRELHLVLDNYGTHTHPRVRAWLARNPRIHLHFTPTSASWMNLVEIFFGIITRKAIRRGTFTSVADLIRAIRIFIDAWNQRCQPFQWTKTPEQVLAKAMR